MLYCKLQEKYNYLLLFATLQDKFLRVTCQHNLQCFSVVILHCELQEKMPGVIFKLAFSSVSVWRAKQFENDFDVDSEHFIRYRDENSVSKLIRLSVDVA